RRTSVLQPVNFADLLSAYSGDWAVDLVINLLQKSAESNAPNYSFVNSLQDSHNPRIIPTLIGLVDMNDSRRIGFNPFESVLRQITRVGWNGSELDRTHDGVWWRLWWHDNKKHDS